MKINASNLANYITKEIGFEFKANWTGVWDISPSVKEVEVAKCNIGNGFEQVVKVSGYNVCGQMIYFGPFEIDNFPTEDSILMFYCSNAIYLE